MSKSDDQGGVLCLVPAADEQAVAHAGAAAGLAVTAVASVADFLGRLRAKSWTATLLSLDQEMVDEPLAARVGAERNTGSLFLATPAVSLERAILAERAGALALLRLPLDQDELAKRFARVADEGSEVALPELPPAGPPEVDEVPTLIGKSHEMALVFESVARVARSDVTVLVTGESGSGKEVIARALHWASERRTGPFVAVNCAAIPENLLESELFGHERGAFTGAVARRIGRFEKAHGGTIFLDEIGDMSLVLQAKILRVLEERTVDPVGGDRARPVDVRVVAATNRELGPAREEGTFREDLYYRLAVVELHLPALADRKGDIRELALFFGAYFARKHRRPVGAITTTALRRLASAAWPGNVRQLRNVMDRAVLLADGATIRAGDLRLGAGSPRGSSFSGGPDGQGYAVTRSLEEVEADHIRRVLHSVDGQIGKASSVLGIHRNTLTRKMREHAIDAAHPTSRP